MPVPRLMPVLQNSSNHSIIKQRQKICQGFGFADPTRTLIKEEILIGRSRRMNWVWEKQLDPEN
ncbi:hypothetical protein [Moorena sp. SIO3A2]|uniref:hypothetical protein n=1 Tax=Moorena sp. SIO3A2 TaxID=2607841 RepID=UPI0013BD92D7|nr:hypothetical protein [Moorena sp. SIO3A2]NER91354.1 hypothetical protein [Moorena sp. SIO3A2]